MTTETLVSLQTPETIVREWRNFQEYAEDSMEIVAENETKQIVLTADFDNSNIPCLMLETKNDEELAYRVCVPDEALIPGFRDLLEKMNRDWKSPFATGSHRRN